MSEHDQRYAHLGDWSEWVPFDDALAHAPREPGVYLFRAGPAVVYVGMAGERAGGNGIPQGIRGRLAVYATGKGAVSGLGEAALDRALTDPAWVQRVLVAALAGAPYTGKALARAAVDHHQLQVAWATTDDALAARDLEAAVEAMLAGQLWNKPRRGRRSAP